MGKNRTFKRYNSNKYKHFPIRKQRYKRNIQKNSNVFQLSKETRELLTPFVKNLSSIQLSDIQISAMAKGLKHIPTPSKPSRRELVQDVNLLQRRMRIRYIMRNKKTLKSMHQFKLPSTWTPLDSENNDLENYLEKTKEEICHLRFHKPVQNLTHAEKQALKELADNPNIIIKKMDKGRGVTVINTHDYMQTGLKHLDTHHYELIPEDPTLDTAQAVRSVLEEMNDLNYINDEIFLFLNPFSHDIRTSEMYFLPKLQKPKPKNAPFEVRPIISGINSATYTISKFVDYLLAPIAESQSTYIRDSTDIILKLQNLTLPDNALLVAIDIKAMYTNIDHDMAIEAASEAYKNRQVNYNIKPIPNSYLVKLLTLILKNNTFKFNGLNYKQIVGLMMGSPCSVSLANISIHPLETSFLKSAKNFLCFFRFIDDIFAISTSSRAELQDQIQTLNTLHPNLKFTAEISETSVNFLDITIYKGNDFNVTKKLSTKIYTKPCDTAQYIMPSSTHSPATFKGFIYGEFLRYARNTSEKDEFDKTCNRFKSNLLKRGYKEDFISDIQQLVSHSDRQHILETTGNKPKKKI